ncbi:MAG: hypothetical protein NT166_03730 [Candidatus Aminicenantes bacterium]|nr:hypothetical protein [Candidatus Aminicenantes bacterium]
MKFIILSRSQDLIDSIGRYLKNMHSIEQIESFLFKKPEQEIYQNFLIIKGWLEGLFENDVTGMKHTLAFLDLPVTDCTDLVVTGDNSRTLASLLYLSFPEIYWFFLMPVVDMKADECLDRETFEHFHVLLSKKALLLEKKEFNLTRPVENFLHSYTPLFDPSGFRHFITRKTLEQLNDAQGNGAINRPFFCERKKKALVVDEELSYSFLHSYVAYKFGQRAMMATTKKILDIIKNECNDLQFSRSFEDICLSFPDAALECEKSQQHLLSARDKLYNFFKNIPRRIFVTIGEKGKTKSANRAYRQELKDKPDFKFYKMLYKPYAGIFNLQKEARLKKKQKKNRRQDDTGSGHSQPGRLGLIADILIDRSTRVLAEAKNSNDAIYAAMLALQAQEILGGRTATESIKAVALKHQAEVMAECMFYGVEHNFDVKRRFEEIHQELGIIGKWFGKSTRDIMIFNSELNIVNELARVFRHYSQFDEEQDCLEKVRTLSRKIYRKRNKLLGWLISPLRWYFEFLVGSLARFIAAIVFWPTLFTFIYYFIFGPGTEGAFKNAFIYSINSFFAHQVTIAPNIPDCAMLSFLSVITILLGFFHLGILISHLYTIVSRR